MSSREACQIVGISRRTGRRWRNGNGTKPWKRSGPARTARKVLPPEQVISSSRYLTQDERIYIADRVREKASVRKIAAELKRSPSTISREIRRNGHPGNGRYRPYAAQARADSRRPRPRPRKTALHAELRTFVQEHLDRRWSPEQICQVCAGTSPTGRSCTWSTRRSTRPSTSIRPVPGSAAPTRTPTACCGSTPQGHRPVRPHPRPPRCRRQFLGGPDASRRWSRRCGSRRYNGQVAQKWTYRPRVVTVEMTDATAVTTAPGKVAREVPGPANAARWRGGRQL